MPEPSLEDVLARLDAMEQRLASLDRSLAWVVERLEPDDAVAPVDRPAPRPGEAVSADEVPQSPPEVPPAATEVAPAPPGTEPAAAVDGVGPGADLRQVLTRMFEAALATDDDHAFDMLTALTHSKDLAAPRAVDHLKAFSWRKLRRTVRQYVKEGDPASFQVERTTPPEMTGETRRVKVFVYADGKSPAPVTLERDDRAQGAWRLSQVSL